MADFSRQAEQIIDKMADFGMPAILRRPSGDRPCLVFISEFTPIEMLGRTVEPTERKVVMAATPEVVALPPDLTDRLITYTQPMTDPPTEDENLRIVDPPRKIAPAGEVIYFRLRVREVE